MVKTDGKRTIAHYGLPTRDEWIEHLTERRERLKRELRDTEQALTRLYDRKVAEVVK